MKLLVTGVGDAFTTRSFGTSALIDGPAGRVLIDCPELIHRVIHEATSAAKWPVGIRDIDHVIITHLHGDHCNGLEMFSFYRRFLNRAEPDVPLPNVYATQPVLDRLWEKLAPSMDAPYTGEPSTMADYFHTHLIAPDADNEVAGLSVRCRFTGHPIPTIGMLISDGAGTLGWSGDTPFEQEHIDWLSQADLIVHEAGPPPAHASIESLNALPESLRMKMRLIHLPDGFDPRTTDIQPVEQGEVLTI